MADIQYIANSLLRHHRVELAYNEAWTRLSLTDRRVDAPKALSINVLLVDAYRGEAGVPRLQAVLAALHIALSTVRRCLEY